MQVCTCACKYECLCMSVCVAYMSCVCMCRVGQNRISILTPYGCINKISTHLHSYDRM
jgi:hypothetical protein